MAISLNVLSPTAGHTGGRTLVELNGAGFRLPTPQSVGRNGKIPEAPPSVRVLFGTKPATEVIVVSSEKLYCLTPIHDPTKPAIGVTVENIDDQGNVIESVTLDAAYTFLRPDLTVESDLVRAIRMFVLELKRQLTPNVSWPKSTDYDESSGETLHVTNLPQLPGLVITEIDVPDNAFYSVRGEQDTPDDDENEEDGEDFTVHAPPVTVDIVLTIAGISNNNTEMLNLYTALRSFFRKNIYLEMPRDPADMSRGTVKYELDWFGTPNGTTRLAVSSGEDNLRHFVGQAVIRGFDIEAMAGLPLGGPGDWPTDNHEATVAVGKTATGAVLVPSTRKTLG